MAVLNLSLDTNDTNRIITLCEKDVRFVAAKSLTQTAQQAQQKIKEHIQDAFVLRKPNFLKSIKVYPANKQNLQAKVYTMAGFAALQQTGGKQYPKDGRLAIPQYDNLHQVKAGRKTDVAGSFIMRLPSGGSVIAARQNNQLRILYHLKQLAYNPKRLNMLELGTDVSIKEFPRIFSDNLRNIP